MATESGLAVPVEAKELDLAQAALVEGYMTPAELEWLYDQTQGTCVEVGSYKGRSATAIGLKLKQTGGRLHCVDLWGAEPMFNDVARHFSQLNLPVQMIRSHSLAAAFRFADKSLEFVFLDSSHDYEETVLEILTWLPKLKRGGLLCGHDFGHPSFPGVEQAVNELCPGFARPTDSIWAVRQLERPLTSVERQTLLQAQVRALSDENHALRTEIQRVKSGRLWKLRKTWQSAKAKLCPTSR